MTTLVRVLISSLIGYLFGSFLPGYFLPLWIKKIDIRKVGDGNPGTLNVKRTVGGFLAFITALYDVLKGFIPMFIVNYLFKYSLPYTYLAGFSAVLGHKFPFYLDFRGGRGFATSLSLFFFIFFKVICQSFSVLQVFYLLSYIILYALLLNMAIKGKGDVFTMTMFPIIVTFVGLNIGLNADFWFMFSLVFIIVMEAVKNLIRDGFKFYTEKHTFWRIMSRPFALFFIPLTIIFSRIFVIILIGIILALFFTIDLLRILLWKVENFFQFEFFKNFRIFKEKEKGRVSSITNFLLGIFLSFVLFDINISFASLGFTSLGDMMAKWIGINFGERKIFKSSKKTLEGSLGFLCASITCAFFLWYFNILPFYLVFIGAIIASIVEAVPNPIDDNFSVPIISGTVMELLYRLF
uniref:Glycerol-3-phosphate acyltransferase n=1 Tax=Dictyoglomus thermophilum TaxID=14 RepID=A0A7C3RNB1_DICTH